MSQDLQTLIGTVSKHGKIIKITTRYDFVIEGSIHEDVNYHWSYGYCVGFICKKCGLEVKKMERFYQHRDSNNCHKRMLQNTQTQESQS